MPDRPSTSSQMIGTVLSGRYKLEAKLGSGGMSTVYLASDTTLDRSVAVKVMHRALADDPEFVARFTREAKASAKLSAAEIVAVHDYGTDPRVGRSQPQHAATQRDRARHQLEIARLVGTHGQWG